MGPTSEPGLIHRNRKGARLEAAKSQHVAKWMLSAAQTEQSRMIADHDPRDDRRAMEKVQGQTGKSIRARATKRARIKAP